MFACLGFFALKPWMQQWFAGNAKTVMIPEDEQAAEDSEKNQEGKEDPDRKSTRLNSSHVNRSRMPSSA